MSDSSSLADSAQLERVRKTFEESIETKRRVLEGDHAKTLVQMAEGIAAAIEAGGKLMICGNGGSAADAQHLAAELVVRLTSDNNRGALPAITLALDTSTLTACGNDYGFDDIFQRPLEALGRAGDVLLGITTSGKSPNVRKAFDAAKQRNITCYGFLGGDGGPALAQCDLAFVVPSSVTARIQEAHITAGHVIMDMVEAILMARGITQRR